MLKTYLHHVFFRSIVMLKLARYIIEHTL